MDVKLSIVCVLAQSIAILGRYHPPHWGYGDNDNGPESWPHLFPVQCNGDYQSPIDIPTAETVHDENLHEFKFRRYPRNWDSRFEMKNNGHTICVKTNGEFYLHGGGLRHTHKIEQFHFHWGSDYEQGSEHTFDGRAFPLELHIVTWNIERYNSITEAVKHHDGLAVLGILFEMSPYDNPDLVPIVEGLPYVRDPDMNDTVILNPMDLERFLPSYAHRYYRYHGSLTTPRCYESVTWTIFANTNTISQRQLNEFRQSLTSQHTVESTSNLGDARELLINNYRPVQPLNYRTVYRSFQNMYQGWI